MENFMEKTVWVDMEYRFCYPVGVSTKEYEDMEKLGKVSPVCDTVAEYAREHLESLFEAFALAFENIEDTYIHDEDSEDFSIAY